MEADHFIKLVEGLTGTPPKDVSATDREILGALLADDGKSIGHSQLNELLLLVNKDRTERPFFDFFFGGDCTVGTLAAGVLKFQKLAMLSFGNFIYAYRSLPRGLSGRAPVRTRRMGARPVRPVRSPPPTKPEARRYRTGAA